MRLKSDRSIPLAVVLTAPLACSGLLYGQDSVDFAVYQQWDGGYNANIYITVDPDGPAMSNWDLSWLGSPGS